MILWKNFLLLSEKRATLLALLAVSVMTAYLLFVARKQSTVTVETNTTTFPPHEPGVCMTLNEYYDEQDDLDKKEGKVTWRNKCGHDYRGVTYSVLYTPDVEITRTLMDHLKDYHGL